MPGGGGGTQTASPAHHQYQQSTYGAYFNNAAATNSNMNTRGESQENPHSRGGSTTPKPSQATKPTVSGPGGHRSQ